MQLGRQKIFDKNILLLTEARHLIFFYDLISCKINLQKNHLKSLLISFITNSLLHDRGFSPESLNAALYI